MVRCSGFKRSRGRYFAAWPCRNLAVLMECHRFPRVLSPSVVMPPLGTASGLHRLPDRSTARRAACSGRSDTGPSACTAYPSGLSRRISGRASRRGRMETRVADRRNHVRPIGQQPPGVLRCTCAVGCVCSFQGRSWQTSCPLYVSKDYCDSAGVMCSLRPLSPRNTRQVHFRLLLRGTVDNKRENFPATRSSEDQSEQGRNICAANEHFEDIDPRKDADTEQQYP